MKTAARIAALAAAVAVVAATSACSASGGGGSTTPTCTNPTYPTAVPSAAAALNASTTTSAAGVTVKTSFPTLGQILQTKVFLKDGHFVGEQLRIRVWAKLSDGYSREAAALGCMRSVLDQVLPGLMAPAEGTR